MKIVWMNWKDLKHPLAGGAEVVTEELAQRLVKDGHQVTLIVGGFKGGLRSEKVQGYQIVRVGSRWSVYGEAYQYYRKNLVGQADVVIDEINTIPFFAKWYVTQKNLLFVHMLCREIWFYQLPWFIGWIGYVIEPLYLQLLSDRVVATVSQSTKQDLINHGFKADKIHIISEGIQIPPVSDLKSIRKFSRFTVLSLGSLRPMKRTLDQIKAFELARAAVPELQLKIAGDANDPYGKKVLDRVNQSRFRDDIQYLGRVTPSQKKVLMQKSHVLVVTSIKEGWGLVVTEAASQGTPSIVYSVDGLKDSVINGKTGIVTAQNSAQSMSRAIRDLFQDRGKYQQLQKAGWQWSKKITFEQSYKDFCQVLNSV